MASFKEIGEIPAELEGQILRMNGFEDLCSLDGYLRREPVAEDSDAFLGTARATSRFIRSLVEG